MSIENTSDELNYTDLINGSIWVYLHNYYGHQQLPLELAVSLTIVNVLIFISGLLGNAAVCLVIIRHQSMHTVTNYYLFNLAVSDLMLLIFGLPNDVAIYWHQYPWLLGETFCKVRALLSEMSSYVSVLTIVAFSTERYLSICYPLYLYKMGGLQRAIKIIVCLWMISFFAALPFSIYTRLEYLEYPDGSGRMIEESALCAMLHQPTNLPISELSTLIFFIIPMIVIAVQYTMMGYKISNRTQVTFGPHAKDGINLESTRSQSHKAIVRMLAFVVIAFFVCWAPFHAQRLLYRYGRDSPYFSIIHEWMFFITGILYYFSSTLNPILYNVMSNRYRTAFREILCGGGGASPKRTESSKLNRNSTLRGSHLPSHSTSEAVMAATLQRGDKASAATAVRFNNHHLHHCNNDDETIALVQKRQLTVINNKSNLLIYQLNDETETCI